MNWTYIIGKSKIKYGIENIPKIWFLTNHKCRKKKEKTTVATQGQIKANDHTDFPFRFT